MDKAQETKLLFEIYSSAISLYFLLLFTVLALYIWSWWVVLIAFILIPITPGFILYWHVRHVKKGKATWIDRVFRGKTDAE